MSSMPRKRSSKRRSSPLAALVAVVVLGGTALGLETYDPAVRETQTAAVIAQSGQIGQLHVDPNDRTPADGGTPQPSGTDAAECVSGVDYKVRIENNVPKIHCTVKWQCPTQKFVSIGTSDSRQPAGNHGCDYVIPAPGVSVLPLKPDRTMYMPADLTRCEAPANEQQLSKIEYCLPANWLGGQGEEKCTLAGFCRGGSGERINASQVAGQQHAALVQGQIAAAGGDSALVNQIVKSDNELHAGLTGTNSALSQAIWNSFDPSTSLVPTDPITNAPPNFYDAGDTLLRNPVPQDEFPVDATDVPRDLGPAGSISSGNPSGANLSQNQSEFANDCPGPNCRQGSSWDPRTQTEQRPPAQDCNWFQRNVTGCPGQGQGGGDWLTRALGTPTGGQQQCGYVYGRYVCAQQPQCNAVQQIVSGCPNAFGQQQCGGLMLMLDRCPTGSYNPNNPQNPYNYPQPSCTINVSPQNAQQGQPVRIQWQSQNAQYANISGLGQVGPSGSTTAYPQGPTTYVMNVVGYGNQQGQCQAQYGSGGGTGGDPVAQISCQPLKADVGMQVAISYACQNAATSAGSGFSTGGALSGSSVVTVAAPSFGQHAVNYGLTCSNQGKTHSAQCTIDVNKAAIVLTIVPKGVEKGKEALIGWVTSGMESCALFSGVGTSTPLATSTAGSFKTDPLNAATEFGLTCTTSVGSTKTASTTVQVLD